MGSQGTTRANANTSWTAQPSSNWGQTLPSGIDYKHADCDGDGIVDTLDAMAIILNYGQVHPKPKVKDDNTQNQATNRSSNIDLFIDYNASVSNGQWINIPVSLGTNSNIANDIYSIAFELKYDESLIEANSVSFSIDSSWMGQSGTDLYSISKDFYAIGQLDVGITRLDLNNIDGNGPIGYISFKAENNTNQTQALTFSFDSVSLVNNQGAQIGVNKGIDSIIINSTSVSINDIEPLNNINIYPNPATNFITIEGLEENASLEIYDLRGQLVINKEINNSLERLNIQNLSKGIYTLSLKTLSNKVKYFKLMK